MVKHHRDKLRPGGVDRDGWRMRPAGPIVDSGPPPPKTGVVTCFGNSLQNQEFCELSLGSSGRQAGIKFTHTDRAPKVRHTNHAGSRVEDCDFHGF